MAAIPSDKDGVFAIAHQTRLEAIAREKLRANNQRYKAVNDDTPAMEFALARPTAHAVCRALRQLGYNERAVDCGWAFEEYGPSNLASRVACTWKTHKAQHECRLLHASVRN
jgi:hypothetical protein